jgi:hypothetical protein
VDLDENIPKDFHESAMKILEPHKGMWIGNSFGEITEVERRIHTTGDPLRQQPLKLDVGFEKKKKKN